MSKKIPVHESSGNVFADIGMPDPEGCLARSKAAIPTNQPDPDQRHVLILAHGCNWLICPADRQADADAFFAAQNQHGLARHAGLTPAEPRPARPEWLVPVDGPPYLVEFGDYRIRPKTEEEEVVELWKPEADDR